jgi:predicted HicB family RNase H-like nuclease
MEQKLKSKPEKKLKRIAVRDVDSQLWHEANIAAMKADQSMGDWLNQVIRDKLSKRPE